MDNHTATQHEFTRRCLRLFSEDLPPVKRQKLEEDLPVFAEGINHFGGYNLDAQLAALTAERDSLREQLFKATKDLKRMARDWRAHAAGRYCEIYNPEMGRGLRNAAGNLDDYIIDTIRLAQEKQK